jgi:Leucine-rich repeat (LRR) protein
MSAILSGILSDSGASPTSVLYLNNNSLTKVPEEIRLFKELVNVDLSFNQIDSVPTGSFDLSPLFPSNNTQRELNLNYNPLDSIESEAFQGLIELIKL